MFSRLTMLRWGYKLGGLAAYYTDETHGAERRQELLTLVEDFGGERAARLLRVVRALDGTPSSPTSSGNGQAAPADAASEDEGESDGESGSSESDKVTEASSA